MMRAKRAAQEARRRARSPSSLPCEARDVQRSCCACKYTANSAAAGSSKAAALTMCIRCRLSADAA